MGDAILDGLAGLVASPHPSGSVGLGGSASPSIVEAGGGDSDFGFGDLELDYHRAATEAQRKADPVYRIREAIQPTAENFFADAGADPASDIERTNFLTTFAIEKCGAKTPQDFLDVMSTLALFSKQSSVTGRLLDKLLFHAQRSVSLSRPRGG